MPTKLANTTLYTVEEVAHKLNVTTVSVRNYIRQGHLKGQKVMGRWIVLAEELDEFLKELRRRDYAVGTGNNLPVNRDNPSPPKQPTQST